MKDRNYQKYAVKRASKLSDIYKIDAWAKNNFRKINKTMKKIIYLLFVFQFLTLKSSAEIVKIEIIGNKRITDETF